MKHLFIVLLIPFFCSFYQCSTEKSNKRPNVVIVFLDDSGWSDFEPFGRADLKTPNVNHWPRRLRLP